MSRNTKLLLGVVVALIPLACYGQVAGSEPSIRPLKDASVPDFTTRSPYIPPLIRSGSPALSEFFKVSPETLRAFLPDNSVQAHSRIGNVALVPTLKSVGIGGLSSSWPGFEPRYSQAAQALAWHWAYAPFTVPAKFSFTTLTARCDHFGTSVLTRIRAAVTFGESRRTNQLTLVTDPQQPAVSIQKDSPDGMENSQALSLNWRID